MKAMLNHNDKIDIFSVTGFWKNTKNRSSYRRCCVKRGVFRNFAKFTGKHLCQSLFFNKVAGLRSANLLKQRLWHRCFPANFAKCLRKSFLQNTSRRLLLEKQKLSVTWHIFSYDTISTNSISWGPIILFHLEIVSKFRF